jgi:SAM-dependent methyltransferase
MTITIESVREQCRELDWPARFETLARLAKDAPADQRAAIADLRAEWADHALLEMQANQDVAPVKNAILNSSSKQMRAAVGQAAKRARDRYITQLMSGGGSLPTERFAAGLDERVLEIPLALGTARLQEPGEVLDAGSALNLPLVRAIVRRPRARVTHFTQSDAVEPRLPGDEDRYVRAFGDLRRLEFPDAAFDRVVCVSTLEHVGMDNDRYGAAAERAPDTATGAVAELVRVLAPGGELLISVPYGKAASHGWFCIFDADGLRRLLTPLRALRVEERFFYHVGGWAEDGPQPPASVLEAQVAADVITGVAVVRAWKDRGSR